MEQLQLSRRGYLQQLISALTLLNDQKTPQAVHALDDLLDQLPSNDAINRICAKSLRERSKQEMPMYLRDLNTDDKQINVFDMVLQAVPPVQVVGSMALQKMLQLYGKGITSFTHLNIGVGKGRFEFKLLKELSKISPDKMPKFIRIIGIDIDNASLRETGDGIKRIASDLFPPTTKIEYIPIFAFAEAITPNVWETIQAHNTEILGVVSAFTLHHIPTSEQRQEVINKIATCQPDSFTLLEPDVNHFTSNINERLVNCWNLFGTIFKLVDASGVSKEVGDAIKYKFFGREIEDILGNDEDKRSEKHEEAAVWVQRLKKAGFRLKHLPVDGIRVHDQDTDMEVIVNDQQGYVTTAFENVPLVAIFSADK